MASIHGLKAVAIGVFAYTASIFYYLAAYGHFGRPEFPWEKTDKVEQLKQEIGK